MRSGSSLMAALILVLAATLIPNASAGCATCGRSNSNTGNDQSQWLQDATKFLEGNASKENISALNSTQLSRLNNQALNPNSAKNKDNRAPNRSPSFSQMLVPPSGIHSSDIVLDISPNATEYIDGAINIPYTLFLKEGGELKPVSEIATILGDAGISENDPVVVSGECQPCGGGPSAKTYAYLIMKYLGHKNVRVLDGNINDWVAAKLPTETKPKVLAKKSYTPTLQPELLATYEFVKNGRAQIVDARTFQEYGAGSIPGAINIPYNQVLSNGNIEDEAALKELFRGLSKNVPVVVYTNTGVKASMVWFGLKLMGFDARLYSWQDWVNKQPKLNISLKDAKADPNPANVGDIVRITAVFVENDQSVAGDQIHLSNASSSPEINHSKNETLLTVKGCTDCGWSGFSLGVANIGPSNNKSGFVPLGSASKTSSSTGNLKFAATVRSSEGAEVGKVNLKPASGLNYSGIWNANVAPGVYKVTIVASTPEASKTFPDSLEIEVRASTNKYKNLEK